MDALWQEAIGLPRSAPTEQELRRAGWRPMAELRQQWNLSITQTRTRLLRAIAEGKAESCIGQIGIKRVQCHYYRPIPSSQKPR